MPTTLRFPNDILRLLYWVFFKPITLDRYIHQIDPTLRRYPGFIVLWQHGKEKPELRDLVKLALFDTLVTPILGFGVVFVLTAFGISINWLGVAFGMVYGVAFGVLFGVESGVVGSMAFGVAGGSVGSVMFGVAFSVMSHMAVGTVVSIVVGVVYGVAFGVAGSVADNVVGSVVFGMAGSVAFAMVGGMAGSVAFGVAFGTSFIICYYRFFLYIFQLPLSFFLARFINSSSATAFFRFSPVHWDELIWLPLIGLDQHLVAIGKQNRKTAQSVIAFVAQSFRQQWAATNALIELTAYDVERAKGVQGIANIAEQFTWLPATMPKDLENVLPPIREIAEYTRGALESDTLYNKQTQLRNARTQTQRVREGLALSGNRNIAARFGQALQTWENIFDQELASLQTLEAIPNVYVAGSPLATTSKVFSGAASNCASLWRTAQRQNLGHQTNAQSSGSQRRPGGN